MTTVELGPEPSSTRDVKKILISNVVNPSGELLPYFFENGEKESLDQYQSDLKRATESLGKDFVLAAGVRFKTAGRIYEFDAKGVQYAKHAVVIAETEGGLALGEVIRRSRPVPVEALPERLHPIVRTATLHDFRQREKNRELEDEMSRFCENRIRELNLDMVMSTIEVFQSGKKATVYFTADERIDFRDFVKELVNRFRIRVEMRQVGARDSAKMLGGIGDCGRELCCSTWLREFAPVSIRMAKDQGLALNPNKISGQCGKLKCCLAYEDETYRSLGEGIPHVGKKVHCNSGFASVISKNVLKQEITVILEDGERVTLKKGDWKPVKPGFHRGGQQGERHEERSQEAADDREPSEALEDDLDNDMDEASAPALDDSSDESKEE